MIPFIVFLEENRTSSAPKSSTSKPQFSAVCLRDSGVCCCCCCCYWELFFLEIVIFKKFRENLT